MSLLTFIGFYILGFFITLFILIKWGKELGWGDYDPPHPSYYDDYPSNVHAWTCFSLGWICFIPFNLIVFSYRGLIWITKKLVEKFGS